MQSRDLPCPSCRRPLPADAAALEVLEACPSCGTSLGVIPFPALGRSPVAGVAAEAAASPDDAACFYHPGKKAVVPCDGCGRFLCALCDLEVEHRHLCPSCLESGRKQRTVQSLERSRTRWDLITGTIGVTSFLCGVLSPLAAIANLVITFVAWSKPQSRVAASRTGMVFATAVSWAICIALAFALWLEWNSDGRM